jgi:L-ascorbate metabolism protein UlaG (beta-lactamase superfamily)
MGHSGLWRIKMHMTWYGHSCFRLRSRNGAVVTDPYGDELGYTLPRLRADIVTVSHDHPDHASVKAIRGTPRIIDGPGEYEIKGIFVIGIPSYYEDSPEQSGVRNTVFLFDLDGVTVCHLGDLHRVPTQSQIEELGDVDVLLIPVGGGSTLDPAKAAEVISLLEPKVVVPMHYRTSLQKGLNLQSVGQFLQEMGLKDVAPIDRVTITKSGLPSETQVIVMDCAVEGSAS